MTNERQQPAFPGLYTVTLEQLPSAAGLKKGEARKEEGQTRATVANGDFWCAATVAAAHVVATMAEFTSDDVWAALTEHDANVPARASVMGSVMRGLCLSGQAEDTGRVVKTQRADGQARKITVWRSKVQR